MPDVVERMAAHFAPSDLRAKVAAALKAAGKDRTNTTVEELSGLDHFHVEGIGPTRRLAELAGVSAFDLILDAGCGMGGPARYLAKTYGCTVRGIDMTDAYLQTAALLNDLTGLNDKVLLQRGDVTDIPFPDQTFDVVWTQHAAQSVPDKKKFFAEMFRVLRPGGRCVVHDLYRGPGDPIHFPAFWGPDESISFLVSDDEMRRMLEAAGLEVTHWEDSTESAIATNAAMHEGQAASVPAEGGEALTIPGVDIFLLFGDQTLVLAENSVKDMEVRSIGIFEAVLRRPTAPAI